MIESDARWYTYTHTHSHAFRFALLLFFNLLLQRSSSNDGLLCNILLSFVQGRRRPRMAETFSQRYIAPHCIALHWHCIACDGSVGYRVRLVYGHINFCIALRCVACVEGVFIEPKATRSGYRVVLCGFGVWGDRIVR